MLDAKYLAKNKVESILDNLEKELESFKEKAKDEIESLKEEVSGSLSSIRDTEISATGSLAVNATAFATGYAANASTNFINKIVPQLEGCPPKTPEEAINLAIKEGTWSKPSSSGIAVRVPRKPPFNIETALIQLEQQQEVLLRIDKRTTLLRKFAEVTTVIIDISKAVLAILSPNPFTSFAASQLFQKIQKYEVIVRIILYIMISIDDIVDKLIDRIEDTINELNKCLEDPAELKPEIVALRERIRISTPSKGSNIPEQDYRGYFLVLKEELINNIPLRNVEILQQGVVVAETDKTFASSVEVIFQEARLQVDRLLK